MLSSGANVIICEKMISSGANVIMVSSGANVIIWCYHVILSSGMITHPFLFFLKTSLTRCHWQLSEVDYLGHTVAYCRLNMELDFQSLFGLHVHSCTQCLRPRNPPPPPSIWAHILGRYWSAEIDDFAW